MNGTSGFRDMQSSSSRSSYPSGTSNGVTSEQVLGIFSVLTTSSLSRQALAQSEKMFLTPFNLLEV